MSLQHEDVHKYIRLILENISKHENFMFEYWGIKVSNPLEDPPGDGTDRETNYLTDLDW